MDIIQKYFPDLSSLQVSQFESLDSLYREWNNRINVISRKDIDHLEEHHILHSLAIARVVTFADNTKVVDVGTGGGFPGIPLAIYFPSVHFHLVDSIGKKIKVVNEIVSALDLKNVTTEHKRIEDINGEFDFAVSRAVATIKEMIDWIKPLIQVGNKSSLSNGVLFLKGGNLETELSEIKMPHEEFSISNFFKEEYFTKKKIVYLPTSMKP